MFFGCHPEVLIRDTGSGHLSSDPRLSAHFAKADSAEGLPGLGNRPVADSVLAPDNGLGGSAWCSLTRGSPAAAGGLSGSLWSPRYYPEGLCVQQSTRHILSVKPLCGSCCSLSPFVVRERRAQDGAATTRSSQRTSVGRDNIFFWRGGGESSEQPRGCGRWGSCWGQEEAELRRGSRNTLRTFGVLAAENHRSGVGDGDGGRDIRT